jgi:hypothetical protein
MIAMLVLHRAHRGISLQDVDKYPRLVRIIQTKNENVGIRASELLPGLTAPLSVSRES